MKIGILLSSLFKDDLGPLNPVGPGAAATPAPMVVTPLRQFKDFCRSRVNELKEKQARNSWK